MRQKAESAKQEKNRATVVALNAEIRRTKAKLLEEDLPKLQRLAVKKVTALPAFPPFAFLCEKPLDLRAAWLEGLLRAASAVTSR